MHEERQLVHEVLQENGECMPLGTVPPSLPSSPSSCREESFGEELVAALCQQHFFWL